MQYKEGDKIKVDISFFHKRNCIGIVTDIDDSGVFFKGENNSNLDYANYEDVKKIGLQNPIIKNLVDNI